LQGQFALHAHTSPQAHSAMLQSFLIASLEQDERAAQAIIKTYKNAIFFMSISGFLLPSIYILTNLRQETSSQRLLLCLLQLLV
jgi:hypothetical protein